MPISQETLEEIQNRLENDIYLRPEYSRFLLYWLAFNRAYNEMETASHERERVVNFARHFNESHWEEIRALAGHLAALECIGSKRETDTSLLIPEPY